METAFQERAKSKKLRVVFPDGGIICYSSSKTTFVESLRLIGAEKLRSVDIEVCHLPIFSQTIYPDYKDFMEPIGDGWYVNTQGTTYNKYAYLKIISDQLGLGLQVEMSEDFKGERIHRGPKSLCVLEVTFPDKTVIGEDNTSETFMQCIWKLGIDRVKKLNLKQGGKDLITNTKQYNGQVQVDVNRWLIVPGALNDKVKLLRVISAMLHIKLEIESFSTSKTKAYKRISKDSSSSRQRKYPGQKYPIGTTVYSDVHGQGRIIDYSAARKIYRVRFSVKYAALPVEQQMFNIREGDFSLL